VPPSAGTPVGATPPAASTGTAGNPSYASYSYQIDATVWLGLELMLAKGLTQEFEIEPPSHEDVEASLIDPTNVSLGVSTASAGMRLIVQIKSRTTAPWTSKDLAEVLLGKQTIAKVKAAAKGAVAAKKRGPAPRARPVAMLEADLTAKYLFVTNEATEAGLRPHENTDPDILSFPDPGDLPTHSRNGRSAAARAALGKRIGLCTELKSEILEARIFKLLDQHGNIPPQNHADCFEAMRKAVSLRLEGQFGGRWTFADLMAIIISHGGGRLAHRRHDQFVPPRSFAGIEQALDNSHAVIIVGPSGTGKTLGADVIAGRLRRRSPSFLEIFPQNAGEARSALTEHGPLLLHLRDPWGDASPSPEATRWTADLPALFRMAGPAHKFLVTTRNDIFQKSQPSPALASYTIAIEPSDYDDAQRGQIYDNHAADLSGHALALASTHREAFLRNRPRPYQIERFIAALPREREDTPRPLYQIVDETGIEAIAAIIRDQILNWGDDGIASAAILWGLLTGDSDFTMPDLRAVLRVLRAQHHLKPHVEGLIDFLEAGRNLRIKGETVRLAHPRVAQGLILALARDRAETEAVLTALADALLTIGAGAPNWASLNAVAILRTVQSLEGVEVVLSEQARRHLDQALLARLTTSAGRGSTERAFSDLTHFATTDNVARRFAATLLTLPPQERGAFSKPSWVPPVLEPKEAADYAADPATPLLLSAFVRGVLPFTQGDYEEDFLEFARRFSDDLGPAFGDAAATLALLERPGDNLSTIIAGAVADGDPGYDAVIDNFIAAEAEANQWLDTAQEDQRRAREHEVDAIQASHIIEEPSERFYNATEGLKITVRQRYRAEGWGWINGHAHAADIIRALAGDQRDRRANHSLDYLRTLLDHADDRGLPAIWALIERNWKPELLPNLVKTLARDDISYNEWRKTLAAIASDLDKAGTDILGDALPRLSATRRLELVLDLDRADARDLANRLVDQLPPLDSAIARMILDLRDTTELHAFVGGQSAEVRDRIAAICSESPDSVARILICLAALCDGSILETAERLLATGDEDEGSPALFALIIRDGPAERALIRQALSHPRYPVRRMAMQHLVPLAADADRAALLGLASDHSADIRLAWAELMRRHRWPDAESRLAGLSLDDRDFSLDGHYGMGASWPRYSAARSAARALEAYDSLTGDTIATLLQACHSPDPFVHCAALRALATRPDDRIPSALRAGIAAPGLKDHLDFRVVAQAATWAYFDRAAAGLPLEPDDITLLEELGETGPPWLAGFALAALGVSANSASGAYHARLAANGQHARADLIALASIYAEHPVGSHVQSALVSARLEVVAEDADRPPDPAILEWYATLAGPDVENLTAWLTALALQLPPSAGAQDPHVYRIPEVIPIMTMYSMTPYREEEQGRDEGY
jgi:hypothetical protein